MEVRQGDIFWISPNEANGLASDYTHPHVVVKGNTSNTVVVSQVFTVDKAQFSDYIGTLAERRINQVLAGMRFLQALTQHHE